MGLVSFDFAMQRKRGGALSAATVEMSSGRVKGMVTWFNATKGSGFVTPDNGGGYLYFHQPSLKSDERDGYRSLNIGDSVEFKIRADWDGRPRAFGITALGGGALTGGFHPDGGNHGCGDESYGEDGDLKCGGGGCYDGRGGHDFQNCGEDDVVWDDELLHDPNPRDGLLQQLSQGGFVGSQEIVMECSRASSTSSQRFVGGGMQMQWPTVRSAPQVFAEMSDQCKTHQRLEGTPEKEALRTPVVAKEAVLPVFSEMPLGDVIWDEDAEHVLDCAGGLLDQLAQRTDYLIEEEAKSITKLDAVDKLPHVCGFYLLHMDVVSDVFDKMPLENEVSDTSKQAAFMALVVWDEELSSEGTTHDSLLQQIASGKEYLSSEEKAINLIDNNILTNVDVSSLSHLEAADIGFVVEEMNITSEGAEMLEELAVNYPTLHGTQIFNKIPAWKRNGFSPGTIEHKHDLCIKTKSQEFEEFMLQVVQEQYELRDATSMFSFAGRHMYVPGMCELCLVLHMVRCEFTLSDNLVQYQLSAEYYPLPRSDFSQWSEVEQPVLRRLKTQTAYFTSSISPNIWVRPRAFLLTRGLKMMSVKMLQSGGIRMLPACEVREETSLRSTFAAPGGSSEADFTLTTVCGFSVQFAVTAKLQLFGSFHGHYLLLIIFWIIRPWDPGIRSSVRLFLTAYMHTFFRRDGKQQVRRPGCVMQMHVVAWGQATFRRGGSVTPRPSAALWAFVLPRQPITAQSRIAISLQSDGWRTRRREQKTFQK